MSQSIVLIATFVVSFALIACILVLISEVPRRRRLVNRLEAVRTLVKADARYDMEEAQAELLKGASSLDRFLLKLPLTHRLGHVVDQSGVGWDAPALVLISITSAGLAFFLLTLFQFSPPLVALVTVLTASLPFLYVFYRRHQNLRKFEELFPETIDMLARAVRAGYAFTTGLELIAKEMPQPVAREFRRTYDQQNLGLPLRDALDHLQQRVPLPDVRIFVVLLKMQQESGGNLAEMLDNLAKVIRERFKLLRQVQVHTAEGRMSMLVLGLLPPVAATLFWVTNPRYIRPLFEDPLGHQMIAAGIIMQLVGILWIRKIVRLKV